MSRPEASEPPLPDRPGRRDGTTRVADTISARWRQGRRILAEGGSSALVRRQLTAVARRLPIGEEPDIKDERVLAVDLADPFVPEPLPLEPDGPMTLNWVMTPPGKGSGGHTTVMRIIAHLESKGHRCRIYLHDVYGGDAQRYTPIIRERHPNVAASVHDLDEGIVDAHATFATSWPTAYIVFAARSRGVRCYLVQDFEPWFYARGTEYVLSENTYRMGLHGITAGRWLAQVMRDDYGMTADHFDFGCDTHCYHPLGGPSALERSRSVAFFSRSGTPRRAAELGRLAMQLVSEARPDVTIHTYGELRRDPPFPAVHHGVVTPTELNEIYNRCGAGLSLSMTNVSLVPHEMLAAGCIPVVNDAEHNRVVLDNEHVRYALADPRALADALIAVLDAPDLDANARKASASVHGTSWADACDAVERSVRNAIARAWTARA